MDSSHLSVSKVENISESLEWLYNQTLTEISLTTTGGISFLQLQENLFIYTGYNLTDKPYILPYLYSQLLQDKRVQVYKADKKTLVQSVNDIHDTTVFIATEPLWKQVIGARDTDSLVIGSPLTDIEIKLLQVIGSKRNSGITLPDLRKHIALGVQQIHYQIYRLSLRGLVVKLFFYRVARVWLAKFIPDSLSLQRTKRDLVLIENILVQVPGFTMSIHDIGNLLGWDTPRLVRNIENLQYFSCRTRLPSVFCAIHSLQYETESEIGINNNNNSSSSTTANNTDNDGGDNGDNKEDTVSEDNTVNTGLSTRVRLLTARLSPSHLHTDKQSSSNTSIASGTNSIKGQSLCFTLATPSLPQSIIESHPSAVNNPLVVIDELALFRGADYALYSMNHSLPHLSALTIPANSFVTGPTSDQLTRNVTTLNSNSNQSSAYTIPVPLETTLSGDYVPIPSFPSVAVPVVTDIQNPLSFGNNGDTEELLSPFYTDLGVDYSKGYREGLMEGFTLEFGIDQHVYRLVIRSGTTGTTGRHLREQFRYRTKRVSILIKALQDGGLVTNRIIIMNKNNVMVTYADADFASGSTGDLFLDDIPDYHRTNRSNTVTKILNEHKSSRSIFLKLLRNPFSFASETMIDQAAENIRDTLGYRGIGGDFPTFSNSILLGAAALARLDNISLLPSNPLPGNNLDEYGMEDTDKLPMIATEKSALNDAMQQLPVGFRNILVSNSDVPTIVTTSGQRRIYIQEFLEKYPIATTMELKRFVDGINYQLVDVIKELRELEGKNPENLHSPDMDNKTLLRLIDAMVEDKAIQAKAFPIEDFMTETSVSLSKNGRITVVFTNDLSDTNPNIRAAAVDVCNYNGRLGRITKAMEEGRNYVRLLTEPIIAAAKVTFGNVARTSSSPATKHTTIHEIGDDIAMTDVVSHIETSGQSNTTNPNQLDPSYNLLMSVGNSFTDSRTKNELYAVVPIADHSRGGSSNKDLFFSGPSIIEMVNNAPKMTDISKFDLKNMETGKLTNGLSMIAPRTMLMDFGTVPNKERPMLRNMTLELVKSLQITPLSDNEDNSHHVIGESKEIREKSLPNRGEPRSTGGKPKRITPRKPESSDAENEINIDNDQDENNDGQVMLKRSKNNARVSVNSTGNNDDGENGTFDENGFDFDDDDRPANIGGSRERTIRLAVIPPLKDSQLIQRDSELRGCKLEDIASSFVAADDHVSPLPKTPLSFASKFIFDVDTSKRTRRRYDWTLKDEELLMTAFATDRVDKEYALQARYYRARLRYVRNLHIYTHLYNFAKLYGTHGKGALVDHGNDDEDNENNEVSDHEDNRTKTAPSKKVSVKVKTKNKPVEMDTIETPAPIIRPRRQIVVPQRYGDTVDNLSDIDLERSSSSDSDALMDSEAPAIPVVTGPPIENFDICVRCLQNVRQVALVCCDKCPRSFCCPCLGRTEPPEDDPWFCGECNKPIAEKLKILNAQVLALPPLPVPEPLSDLTVETKTPPTETRKKVVVLNLSPVSSVKGFTGISSTTTLTADQSNQRSTRRKSTTKAVPVTTTAVPDPPLNLDICVRCLQNVNQTPLVCCDKCPRSFCCPCLGRTEPPEDDPWFCGECNKPIAAKVLQCNTVFLQSLAPPANHDPVPEVPAAQVPRGNKGAVLLALSPVSSVDGPTLLVPPLELNPAEQALVNLDVCNRCLSTVYQVALVCCDKCPRSFCCPCLGRTEPPEDDPWFCGECNKPIARAVYDANAKLPSVPAVPLAVESSTTVLTSTMTDTDIAPLSSSSAPTTKTETSSKLSKDKNRSDMFPIILKAPEYPGAGKGAVFFLKDDAKNIGNGMWYGKKLVKPDPPALPKASSRWNLVAEALGIDEDTVVRSIRRLLSKKSSFVHALANRLDIARQQRGVRVYTRNNTFFYQLNPTVLSGGRYLANEEMDSDSDEDNGTQAEVGLHSNVKRPTTSTENNSNNITSTSVSGTTVAPSSALLPLDTRHVSSLFQHFTTRAGYALPPEVDSTLHPDTRTMWPGLDRLPSLIMTKILLVFISYAAAQNYYNALLTPDGIVDLSEKEVGSKVLRRSIHALRNLGENIDLLYLVENLKNRQLILKINGYKVDKKLKSNIRNMGTADVKTKTSTDQLAVDESDENETLLYCTLFGDDSVPNTSGSSGRYELKMTFWNSFVSSAEAGFDKHVMNEMNRWNKSFFGTGNFSNTSEIPTVDLPTENRYDGGLTANILPLAILDTESLDIDLSKDEKVLNDRYTEIYHDSYGKHSTVSRMNDQLVSKSRSTKSGYTKSLIDNRLSELRKIEENVTIPKDAPESTVGTSVPSSDIEELSSENDNGMEEIDNEETGKSGKTGSKVNENEKLTGIGKLLEYLHDLRQSLKPSATDLSNAKSSSTALVTPPIRKRGRVENIETDLDMHFRPLKRYVPRLSDSSVNYQSLSSSSSSVWWNDHPVLGPGFDMIVSHEVQLLKEIESRGIRGATVEDILRFILSLHNTKDQLGTSLSQFYSLHAFIRDMIVRAVLGKYCLPSELHYDNNDSQQSSQAPLLFRASVYAMDIYYYIGPSTKTDLSSLSSSSSATVTNAWSSNDRSHSSEMILQAVSLPPLVLTSTVGYQSPLHSLPRRTHLWSSFGKNNGLNANMFNVIVRTLVSIIYQNPGIHESVVLRRISMVSPSDTRILLRFLVRIGILNRRMYLRQDIPKKTTLVSTDLGNQPGNTTNPVDTLDTIGTNVLSTNNYDDTLHTILNRSTGLSYKHYPATYNYLKAVGLQELFVSSSSPSTAYPSTTGLEKLTDLWEKSSLFCIVNNSSVPLTRVHHYSSHVDERTSSLDIVHELECIPSDPLPIFGVLTEYYCEPSVMQRLSHLLAIIHGNDQADSSGKEDDENTNDIGEGVENENENVENMINEDDDDI